MLWRPAGAARQHALSSAAVAHTWSAGKAGGEQAGSSLERKGARWGSGQGWAGKDLKCQADAEFFHHVRLGLEVQVHLCRAADAASGSTGVEKNLGARASVA